VCDGEFDDDGMSNFTFLQEADTKKPMYMDALLGKMVLAH
jgi:hypothetical protein